MISYLRNNGRITPAGSLTLEELHSLIVNPDRKPFSNSKDVIKKLRATTDKEEQSRLKCLLPVIVPAAMISTRAESVPLAEKIIQYSGFIQVDIDPQDNPNLPDAAIARDWLAENIPYIALAAISARGKGIWGLVALYEPEKFSTYCEPLSEYFSQAGITIDKTKSKSPTELRYFAPDAGAILKFDYMPFRIPTPKPIKAAKAVKYIRSSDPFEDAKRWVESKHKYSFIEGQRHNYIFWLCYSLYRKGISEQSIESYIYTLIPQTEIKSNCIRGGIEWAKR